HEASIVARDATGVPRHMQLAVDSHAAVRQVRGADREEAVVDGEDLRMDIRIAKVRRDAVADRIVEPERVPGPGRFLAEHFEILGLPEPDRELLLEGLGTLVHHHDDLDPSTVRPPHARDQRLPDAEAAEILRLDVDEALGRADRVNEQALDLADAVPLGGWLGPADRHAGRAERKQPAGARGWRSASAGEPRWLTPARTPPALPEQVGEGAAHVGPRQVGLYVVVRFVRRAAREP